jgi:hypothetical protein
MTPAPRCFQGDLEERKKGGAQKDLDSSLPESSDVSQWRQRGHGFISCPFISLAGRVTCSDNQNPKRPFAKGEALYPLEVH